MDNEKPGLGEPTGADGDKRSGAKDDPTTSAPHHSDGMPSLPVAEPFQGFTANLPKEPRGVFSQLVSGDGDITGLIAYSLYKQNKLDWLSVFQTAKGRDPTDEELAAYILGEGTPRRIATYRHLAEATLAGSGPMARKAGDGPSLRNVPRKIPTLGDNPTLIATYAVIALVLLIAFLIAAHYTMSSR